MMRSVVILTGSHLSTNPRALKEARALSAAGFEVEVLGAWSSEAFKSEDLDLMKDAAFRFTPTVDWTSRRTRDRLPRLSARLRAKAGQALFAIAGVPNRWQLNRVLPALKREAFRRHADLFIAHSEAALSVAKDLADAGRCVGVDMEDWFSEDLLPQERTRRPTPLLRLLEGELLRRASFAVCTSRAMSEALSRAYGCPPPTVVYNAFPWADRQKLDGRLKDRSHREDPSIHWYSQTIGPGRGLEDLLAALALLEPRAELHLRGNPTAGFARWLEERVPGPWTGRVHLHGLVPNEELLSRIAEHDIGFAGEMTYCASRRLTVTNKILHYLLGGLAVVASDTPGQNEVAAQAPGAVALYPPGDASTLAAVLRQLLTVPEELKRRKAAALTAAETTFCWERQKDDLLRSLNRFSGADSTCA